MGGTWRMFTYTEVDKLVSFGNKKWADMGILGYKITNPNDPSKYVFFPAAGYCRDGANQVVGMYGFYFASSTGLGEYVSTRACSLSFYSTNLYRSASCIRYWGISMRSVIELTEAEYQDWLLKQ